MNTRELLTTNTMNSDFFVEAYLGDLTEEEMLARPCPGANHAAWQLGHLIAAECFLVEGAAPGSMPKLPDGFAERHTKESAASDDRAKFLTKAEYFRLAKEVRAATLRAIEKFSDADLDQPVPPKKFPPFVKNVGDLVLLVGRHWTLHAGQWAVLRRKLGRPRKF